MTSLRHKTPTGSVQDAALDAARGCILTVGWRRTTLTDVAKRAGVSRMTLYRRWPDMESLLADLMTREWTSVLGGAALQAQGSPVDRLATGAVTTVRALRDNELFRTIVEIDPELLLPYLLERRGRTQSSLLSLLEDVVVEGQRDGTVRAGSATLLARAVLLAAHGFVLSAETMTDERGPYLAEVDAELRTMVERYLTP